MAASLIQMGADLAYIRTSDQLTIRKLELTKPPLVVRCLDIEPQHRRFSNRKCEENTCVINRRDAVRFIGITTGFCFDHAVRGAGLPLEEKAKLCDATCEKEIENVPMVTTESGLQFKDIKIGNGPSPPIGFQVAANYVAMLPSGQVFDSSLDKGQVYIFRVGSGQVIKGLDEGVLSMKVGGKRRLYIPGPLAFPKGLSAAAGRPRVPPSSPVIFDVSLEYIPGLEIEEE